MSNFINNCIFTKYGFARINSRLIDDLSTDFNFSKIKIGNSDITLDENLTDLTSTVYEIIVENIEKVNGTVKITATIPDTVKGFNIRQLGLYETINDVDYLFAYASVNTIKPDNLDYELFMEIDFNLAVRNLYPTLPEISVTDYNYANITEKDISTYNLLYVSINLERCIYGNATKLGYNKAQIYYLKELSNKYIQNNYNNISKFIKLLNYINSSDILGSYYFNKTFNEIYKINDLKNDDSYLDSSNKLFTSANDGIIFNDSAFSINAKLKINSIDNDFTIFNKVDDRSSKRYFSFDFEDNNLKFTIYSVGGEFSIYHEVNAFNLRKILNKDNNYTFMYNGDSLNPQIKLYINGEEESVIEEDISFDGLNESVNDVTFKNYKYSEITGDEEKVGDIDYGSILFINRELTENEILYIKNLNNNIN